MRREHFPVHRYCRSRALGGTAEMAMLMAKKTLLRPVARAESDPEIAELEG